MVITVKLYFLTNSQVSLIIVTVLCFRSPDLISLLAGSVFYHHQCYLQSVFCVCASSCDWGPSTLFCFNFKLNSRTEKTFPSAVSSASGQGGRHWWGEESRSFSVFPGSLLGFAKGRSGFESCLSRLLTRRSQGLGFLS